MIPKGKKQTPRCADTAFISFKQTKNSYEKKKNQKHYRVQSNVNTAEGAVFTQNGPWDKNAECWFLFANRMYISTENLGRLKIILFSSFCIFPINFFLPLKTKTFFFFFNNDKVISKFEIRHDDRIICFIVFIQHNRISCTYSVFNILGTSPSAMLVVLWEKMFKK